jgi:hypothetical protein
VPVFVIAYYIILERYDKSELMTDDFIIYFVEIVVFWHFFSRVMRSAFEMGKNNNKTVLFYVLLL